MKDGYSCIKLFSLIPIYSEFKRHDYAKKKWFGGVYKKVYNKSITKHYLFGLRISRIAERDFRILGIRSCYLTEKHVISFAGVPLISTVYHNESKEKKLKDVAVEKRQIEYLTSTIREQVENIHKENRNVITVEKQQVGHLINTIKGQVEDVQKRMHLEMRVIYSIVTSLQAAVVHPHIFTKFKGYFAEKEIVICGCGPTFSYYSPIKNAVHIGINRAFKRRDIRFDFLFAQDAFDEGMDEINTYYPKSCEKFYGWLPSERAREVHRVVRRIHPHDYLKGRAHKYILEDLVKGNWAVDLTLEPLGDFQGTVFSALQFACYTMPKKIFLVGCDCSSGHFYKDDGERKLSYQYDSWTKFKEFVDDLYPDVEIISINPVGLKGMFRDLYTSAFTQDHPEIKDAEIIINE